MNPSHDVASPTKEQLEIAAWMILVVQDVRLT